MYVWLLAFFSPAVTIKGALSQVGGNLNDMLVQSYRQVAELASEPPRAVKRASSCYEKLLVCLRARTTKNEAALALMQQATREIVAMKLEALPSEAARDVRRLHAKHDPHKRIHMQNREVFRKVISTVSTSSPGAYFDELVGRCKILERLESDSKQGKEEDGTDDGDTGPGGKGSRADDDDGELKVWEVELACLVELSNAV